MKFVCDRCKTRYSIGDERVRGKILKIRCKNCANVITVREGMSEDAGGDPLSARRQRPTTQAPSSTLGGVNNGSAAASPPAALEEEWYCSIDGQQAGPFALAEAQRWVATKPFDAELHCWCEGFDDWLPVDKVSHFRNLRRPPRAAPAPPAIPRREEEPKPLFASTMAALERHAEKSAPVVARRPAAEPEAAPTRPNGAVPQTAKGTSPHASISTPTAKPNPSPLGGLSPASAPSPAFGSNPGAGVLARNGAPAITSPGMGVHRSPIKPPDVFEARGPIDDGDSATAIGAPPIHDLDDAPVPAPPIVAPTTSRPDPRKADGGDDLEIGEVSRVVNLADIMPRSAKKPAAGRPGVRTGPVARFGASELGAALPGYPGGPVNPAESAAVTTPLGALGAGPGDSLMAPAAAVAVQRRGLIILMAAAAVLLAGGIAAVIMIVQQGDDNPAGSLAQTGDIDTSRPEDVIRRAAAQEPILAPGSAAKSTGRRWNGVALHPMPTPTSDTPETGDPTKAKLRIDEIEDMARKQNDGTNRCYMRAQKGALGYEIQDLKKIAVTVTVGGDGTVSDVDLSDHRDDQFGKCLIGRVKAWKFRESPGGTFRFELAFAQP